GQILKVNHLLKISLKTHKTPGGYFSCQSAFVLMVISLTILGPSGWILSRLDHYKTRD
uniref:Uncharacterized protein n=1 Tax=Neolamprologus brichardi TaxID=32507 RepID=A0A3Q4IGJ9_NEOBR